MHTFPFLFIVIYKPEGLETCDFKPKEYCNPSKSSLLVSYKTYLAHDHTLEAGHIALLCGNFKVSVDDSDSQEDTSSAAQRAE